MQNNAFKNFLILILLIILSGAFAGCVASSAEEESKPAMSSEASALSEDDENAFYGEVVSTETDFGGILVKPESDILPAELVIHSEEMPKVSVGDRVRVVHGGQITLSLPGQIFGATVTVAE